jgi:hypothetical protein
VRVDLGVNSAMGGGAEWVWDWPVCNSGSTGGSQVQFWPRVDAQSGRGTGRLAIVGVRVDLGVNSAMGGGAEWVWVCTPLNSCFADASRVEFWPRVDAQSGWGSARLVILAVRVDLGFNSGRGWMRRVGGDVPRCNSGSASGSRGEFWLCEWISG